jgi:hypothetical protein
MNDEEMKFHLEQGRKDKEKLKLFKSQYTTNEQILDGLYRSNQQSGSLYHLGEFGFDLSKLTGKIIDGSSALLTKEIFDNQIIGDYELAIDSSSHQPNYRIVKINFNQEYSKVFAEFKILLKQKNQIEGTLWAYKFDSDMENPDLAKIYEEKKIEIDKQISDFMPTFDFLANSFKDTLDYLEKERSQLKR